MGASQIREKFTQNYYYLSDITDENYGQIHLFRHNYNS